MTTITIEREVLDEIVELFDSAITARFPHEILRDLRAALAAPATAPEQPAWQDAPNVPGLWSNSVNWRVHKVLEETIDAYQDTNARWFGPIPEDKP